LIQINIRRFNLGIRLDLSAGLLAATSIIWPDLLATPSLTPANVRPG
jgi:hypothetical protein